MEDVKSPFGNVPIIGAKKYRTREETVIGGAQEQANILKNIGERLKDVGHDYVGSIAVHIYKSELNASVTAKTQNCVDKSVAPIHANWALQQASIALAKSYGWTPPATRQDVFVDDDK